MNSTLISEFSTQEKGYYARSREIFIRLSLLAIMGVSCVLLMLPFLRFILCGIIIAVGMYPAYCSTKRAIGGRRKLAAVLCSLLLLLVLVVPAVFLASTLVDGIQSVTQQLETGRLNLPPPPDLLGKLPVIGNRLVEFWTLCSTNLSEAVKRYGPQIEKSIPMVLSASAGISLVIVQFLLAIVLAGYLLATSEANGRFTDKVFVRIFGYLGAEIKDLTGSTIKTVTNGILGVAVIQTLFASIGFWVVGLPGVGLWAVVFLISSILQVGAVVLIPAVLYAFATFSTTRAAIFLAWCIVVGLMDNVLKPILLGRGAKVPMAVIFLGVLGGFMVMNSIIGLFVGAIVLSVGYRLFMAWLESGFPDVPSADETSSLP